MAQKSRILDQCGRVLQKCTSDQLGKVIAACGFPSQTKKDQKIESIIESLRLFQTLPPKIKATGIDVGIKNFAYCTFEVDRSNPEILPKITAWTKLNLHKVYMSEYKPLLEIKLPDPKPKKGKRVAEDLIVDYLEANLVDSTRYLSFLAHKVIKNHIFIPGSIPNIAFIEHQRTRSTMQTSTLPNVMKNSLLENMMYSTFYTLQEQSKNLKNDPELLLSLLVPTFSFNMSNFWIHRYLTELNVDKKALAKDSKSMRTKIVYEWLDKVIENSIRPSDLTAKEAPFAFDTCFIDTISKDIDFKKKSFKNLAFKPTKVLNMLNLGPKTITNFKIDDLMDSLLHAFANVKFIENQDLLLKMLERDADEKAPKQLIAEFIEESRNNQLSLVRDVVAAGVSNGEGKDQQPK